MGQALHMEAIEDQQGIRGGFGDRSDVGGGC